MLTHRGFSAWIHSEGAPVPEYLVSMPDANNCVNCWIPGKPGSKFTVFWQDETNSGIASCSYINIDGTHVPGKFLHGSGFSAKSGVRISKDAERPFVFEAVTEGARDTSASSAKMGTITLEIKRVVLLGTRPSDSAERSTISKTILEKPKGGQICVGLGQEVVPAQQSPMTYQIAPYPKPAGDGPYPRPSTYVTFKFKYRTLEWLQQQDIANEANVSSTATFIRVPGSIKVEDSPHISSKRGREESTTPPSPTERAAPPKKPKITHEDDGFLGDSSSHTFSSDYMAVTPNPDSSFSFDDSPSQLPPHSAPSTSTPNNVIDLTEASEAERQMSVPKPRKTSKARGKARATSGSNSRKASANMTPSAATSANSSTSAIPSSSSTTSESASSSFMFDPSLLPPGAFASMSGSEFDALFPSLSSEASGNHLLPLPDGSLSDITTPSPSC